MVVWGWAEAAQDSLPVERKGARRAARQHPRADSAQLQRGAEAANLRGYLVGCLTYGLPKGIGHVGDIDSKRHGGVREEEHHDADHQQCGAEEVHLGASVLGGGVRCLTTPLPKWFSVRAKGQMGGWVTLSRALADSSRSPAIEPTRLRAMLAPPLWPPL